MLELLRLGRGNLGGAAWTRRCWRLRAHLVSRARRDLAPAPGPGVSPPPTPSSRPRPWPWCGSSDAPAFRPPELNVCCSMCLRGPSTRFPRVSADPSLPRTASLPSRKPFCHLPPAPLLSPAPFQVPTPLPVASGPALPSWPRPRGPRALTVAALAPVVRGEAVVALGPRRALAALAEAGLVAPVVHGADLVAVTLWTDRRTACDQGDFLDLTTLPAGSPHPRPDGGWRLPVASRSRGKTVFPHVHSPLPLWPRRCVARASPFPSLGLSLCICNLSGH